MTFIFKMKKVYQIIILLVSLLYINSSSEPECDDQEVSSRSVCHDQTVDNSGFYCCYLKEKYKGNGNTHTECITLKEAEKKDINKIIGDLEDEDGATVMSLDCKSSFIELGLFSLILLLL